MDLRYNFQSHLQYGCTMAQKRKLETNDAKTNHKKRKIQQVTDNRNDNKLLNNWLSCDYLLWYVRTDK